MALIVSYTDPRTGAIYPNAYLKAFVSVEGHKPIYGQFKIYSTKQAREDGKEPVSTFPIENIIYENGMALPDILEAVYEYGRSMPDFTDVQDDD